MHGVGSHNIFRRVQRCQRKDSLYSLRSRNREMVLRVFLQLISETDPGSAQTAESPAQSQHSATAA